MSTVVLTKEQIAEALDLHAKWYRGEPGGQRANLAGANLDGANLDGANLDGADLAGADLYGANLYGANLAGANLAGANLDGADLAGANLYGANLDGANLDGANLDGANLDRTGLLWAECAWTDHGECGRRLMAVVLLARAKTEELEAREQSVTYMYGCYRGTEAELREYIADGDKDFAHSRTCAADFVAARVAEMLAKHV
jgi:hypothetical protein